MPYRRVFDVVWSGRRHIMMMASQVDRFGNQNLSAIGDWARPKAQLIGVRGAPGNSLNHTTSYWVPAHTARSFVEHVDMVCGVGYDRAAAAGPSATRFHDVRLVVSNLGVFDFDTPDHAMRIRSVHPGVAVDEVVGATGFELVVPDPVPTHAAAQRRGARADPRGARPRPAAGQGDPVLTPTSGCPTPPRAAHPPVRPGRRALPHRADGDGLGGRSPARGRHRQRRGARDPGLGDDDGRRAARRGGRGAGRAPTRPSA